MTTCMDNCKNSNMTQPHDGQLARGFPSSMHMGCLTSHVHHTKHKTNIRRAHTTNDRFSKACPAAKAG
jgi:hypothetical protein